MVENILDEKNKYKAIFEMSPEAIIILDKKGKFLDINNRLSEWLGYDSADVLGKNLLRVPMLSKRSKLIVAEKFAQRMMGKDVPPYELEFTSIKGEKKYGLITATPIRDKKNKIIADLVMLSDITKKREGEAEAANNLTRQKVLSNIAIELNEAGNFDDIMNHIVTILGEYTNVSRVYIFEEDLENDTTSNIYEWCNKGVKPQKNNLQNIPHNTMPSFKKIVLNEGVLFSSDIKKLPKDLYDILKVQSIKSLLVLPIFLERRFFGFIGFDEIKGHKKWTDFDKEFLKTIAELIANAYQRKIMSSNIRTQLDELEKINKLMVGRELEMIGLKNRLKEIGDK